VTGPELLVELHRAVTARVDGATLVEDALPDIDAAGELAGASVLAVGKVALPMFEGFVRCAGQPPSALLVTPARETTAAPPPGGARSRLIEADHPHPTERSVAAAEQARAFVAALGPGDRLVVLLSGGGSALLAAPLAGLSLDDKRATVAAVARAGVTIGELNTVRKHLSAIKGGRLGLATRAAVTVLALSDVIGNDPGTIASGPLSPDPTTFAEARALVRRLAIEVPAAATSLLERGVAGELPETPKPGDPRLQHVRYRVLAGPERVAREARRLALARRRQVGVLAADTEDTVPDLAAAYGARARQEARLSGHPRILVGNGEPRIVVSRRPGSGGRATHLALLMAREIAGLSRVSFLAAGTDHRDGSAPASGAVVDGETWARAVAAGLDPQRALDESDSARPLAALGCLVHGPGRSNLLDLHLLEVGG
jgi:glycerate 2-kinase